ncbi:unnamed protein product [Clonostachys rosea]|uniref:Uncharacterized protein n=1 Tax=Bionectria ochroleuca TaxID=29856 RepID=A0ABY6UHH5_BIOOC|nr:unnamed protein product [Clonostachys rosea]
MKGGHTGGRSQFKRKMKREKLEWTGVSHRATKIVVQPPGKEQAAPQHPLTLTWSSDFINKPDESIFEALPVISPGQRTKVIAQVLTSYSRAAVKPGTWNYLLGFMITEWGSASMSSSLG